jgi:hypothetical protein
MRSHAGLEIRIGSSLLLTRVLLSLAYYLHSMLYPCQVMTTSAPRSYNIPSQASELRLPRPSRTASCVDPAPNTIPSHLPMQNGQLGSAIIVAPPLLNFPLLPFRTLADRNAQAMRRQKRLFPRTLTRALAHGYKDEDCRWSRPTLVGHFEFLEWTPDNHLRQTKFVALCRTRIPTRCAVKDRKHDQMFE